MKSKNKTLNYLIDKKLDNRLIYLNDEFDNDFHKEFNDMFYRLISAKLCWNMRDELDFRLKDEMKWKI